LRYVHQTGLEDKKQASGHNIQAHGGYGNIHDNDPHTHLHHIKSGTGKSRSGPIAQAESLAIGFEPQNIEYRITNVEVHPALSPAQSA
jgi:hypothetical protein